MTELKTFIDLFAGIGGFRLALERNGLECIFSSEVDTACRKVYQDNFRDTPFGDINQIHPEEIPDHDFLTAGFPCQPFSWCGKKEGFKDEVRGTLFFNIVEILEAKRPKVFLLENVKGILGSDKGKTIKEIHYQLEEKLNYTLYTDVIDSYDYGIPHYRQRWYCVGFDKEYMFEFPTPNFPRTAMKEIIEEKANKDLSLKLKDQEEQRIDHHFKDGSVRVQHDNSHCDPKSKKGKYGIYSYLKPDKSLRFYTGDIAKSQIQDDYYISEDGISPTLIATRAPKFWDLKRHTSVLECKRLQTFPDDFKMNVSITQAKKQLGNAVTVKVIEEIAKNIIYCYNKKDSSLRITSTNTAAV